MLDEHLSKLKVKQIAGWNEDNAKYFYGILNIILYQKLDERIDKLFLD